MSRAITQHLLPGQVSVEMSWRVNPRRNWVTLWKPTGDSMGPILGHAKSPEAFNPLDDRITELGLHVTMDDSLAGEIDIDLYWKMCSIGPFGQIRPLVPWEI